MAKYLVTGGAGFIGSHLVEKLLELGHRVRVLDNFSSGDLTNLNNVHPHNLDILDGDVTDANAVQRAMHGCDGVFHLAAISSVSECEKDISQAWHVNLTGTLTVLREASSRLGVPMVFVSSAAVYGNIGDVQAREDAIMALNRHGLDIPSTYAQSKLMSEIMCILDQSVDGYIVRPFNVYGPRQKDGVIARFCQAIASGQKPKLHGSGLQVRDFIYVQDVVMGIILAMNPTGCMEIYNLGTGQPHRLIDVLHYLGEINGSDIQWEVYAPRLGDIAFSCADPTRSAHELGFHCRTSLIDGLQQTLLWHREQCQKSQ